MIRRFPILLILIAASAHAQSLGGETAVERHFTNGQEATATLRALFLHGKLLFNANWTEQEGGGRPLSKGTGRPLSDPTQPLTDLRAFNRISAPDANSCAGCHNTPYGISGGGGDFVTNVFVLGQRFDATTFDPNDKLPTRGSVDESGKPAAVQTMANLRSSTGLFGAGYLEMLARQITEDLQRIRGTIKVGQTKELSAKGIRFGKLTLNKAGLWDTSKVEGLPRLSLISSDSTNPPSLVIRPWHQVANAVSLREFSNTAYNHHHGIQSTERFGLDTDPDGDGFKNELTRGDITAVSIYQAAIQVPRRGLALAAAVHGDGVLVAEAGAIPGAATRPAKAGDSIAIFGTGFGPANPAVPDAIVGAPASVLANELTVFVGGQRAQVDYAGVVGPGLVQINLRVPEFLPAGRHVVVAVIGGVESSAVAAIAVE